MENNFKYVYDGIYGGTFPKIKKATEDYSNIWKNEKGAKSRKRTT